MNSTTSAIASYASRTSAIIHALRLLLDPNRLSDVFVLERAVTTPDVVAQMLAHLRADPRTAPALDAQRRLAPFDLERMAAMPERSLGRAFATFLRERSLDPAALPRLESSDEATFLRAHLYETHDVWHVVTGFETDVAGELGVQAFVAAQIDGALARFLLVGGLVNAVLWAPNDWSRRLEAIARGWALGKRAHPLFGVTWDDLWTTPLTEVRRDLRLLDAAPPAIA